MTTFAIPAGTPADALAEQHLVARAVRGERGAFGTLYQRHVERVFHFVVFRVRDVSVAEDLTQEIFVNALRGIGTLDHPERFAPWLVAIARNRVRNHWRTVSRGPEVVEPEDTDDPFAGVADEDPFAAVEARAAAEDLLAGAARLSDLQHEVLSLRFVAGLSVAETAFLLERTENAIKNLQHHALANLRRHVAAVGGEG